MAPPLIVIDKVQSFIGKEETVSTNGIEFGDVCVPEHQGTWHTYDSLTNETLEEVSHDNRYHCCKVLYHLSSVGCHALLVFGKAIP